MPNNRIDAFVEYVVTGYLDGRKNKRKLFLGIEKKALTDILGGQRLGSSQKDELRETCRYNDIGLAERSNYIVFFYLDDADDLTIDITGQKETLKKITDHFAKMHNKAADEEWGEYKFPKVE